MGCSPSHHHHGHPWQGRQNKRPFHQNSFNEKKEIQPSSQPSNSGFASNYPSSSTKATSSAGKSEGRVAMDKEALLKYIQIEKEVNKMEAMNVVEHLQIKWDHQKNIVLEIKRLEAIYQSRKEQTLKEKKDVDEMPSVRAFFADQAAFEERMSREQEEYLVALNKQEVAQKELEAALAAQESAKAAVKELHSQALKLQALYKEQDALLSTIFNGQYGSELEFRLEREHDAVSQRQQRIAATKVRWQAGRLLVYHGSAQLGYAVKQWECAAAIPVTAMQQRYVVATDTRNYLVAACTNLRNSQNYLTGFEFPYCKADEIFTIERAANNIYTDVATPERHQHALTVYASSYQRSVALLQWFDTVINRNIDKDLLSASEELFEKKRQLRIERVRLIKQVLVGLFGPQEAAAAGLDADANLTDARRLQQQLEAVNQEEMEKLMKSVKIVQPDSQPLTASGQSVSPAKSQQPPQTPSSQIPPQPAAKLISSEPATFAAAPAAAPSQQQPQPSVETQQAAPPPAAPKISAIPLNDLAPPPSQEQLFGDIDSIKKQYEIDMEEYEKAQELNRARVEQGLQEKLAARKSRKARKEAQEQTTEKLLQESANT